MTKRLKPELAMLGVIPRTSAITPIGLDVGAAGVRAVQLRRRGRKYSIIAINQIQGPIPESAAGTAGLNPPTAGELAFPSTREIQACTQAAGFRGRSTALAISPAHVEFHALDIPRSALDGGRHSRLRPADGGPGRLDETVRTEIERLSKNANQSAEMRYWKLPPNTASTTTAVGVCVGTDFVTRAAEACSAAGLKCVRIDTSATAALNFAQCLQDVKPGTVWGVLDIGLREARLILGTDDHPADPDSSGSCTPVLVRRIGTGGMEWTKRIAEALGVSFRAAEVHKRDCGITVGNARDPLGGDQDELAFMIFGALRRDLTDLAAEAKRSYEYVLHCYPSRQAGDLVLTGEASLLRNLDEFLAGALGIRVATADDYLNQPGCRIDWTQKGRLSLCAFAAAIGLVIGD